VTDEYQNSHFLAVFSPLSKTKLGDDLIKSHFQSLDIGKELNNILNKNQTITLGIRKCIIMEFSKWEVTLDNGNQYIWRLVFYIPIFELFTVVI